MTNEHDLLNNGVVLSIIKQNLNHLTPANYKVAHYLLSNPAEVIDQTAARTASLSGTSEATVIRLCKELGFKGYHDFQIRLARDLGADDERPVPENINRQDSPWEVFQKIITAERENLNTTLNTIDKDIFTVAVEELVKTERIGFFSVGSSYPIAYDAYWRFSKIGILCQIHQDTGGQLMIAESLKGNSLAFAISRTGQSKIPVKALKIARENEVTTICLTQNSKSEITNYSDYSFVTSERLNRVHDAATSSRIAHLSVLDALYSAVAVKKWSETTRSMKRYSNLIRKEQF